MMETLLVSIESLDAVRSELEKRMSPFESVIIDLPDEQCKMCYRHFMLFDRWPSLLPQTTMLSGEAIFYNKYYWFLRLIGLLHQERGPNSGNEQQAFKMLESAIEFEGLDLDVEALEEIVRQVATETGFNA